MAFCARVLSVPSSLLPGGAFVGAQFGLGGIPPRFIEGLAQGDVLRTLVQRVAAQVVAA